MVETLPPEIAADYAHRLMQIAATANRDAQTLTRQNLRKYANEFKQSGAGKVQQIVTEMEAASATVQSRVKVKARKIRRTHKVGNVVYLA